MCHRRIIKYIVHLSRRRQLKIDCVAAAAAAAALLIFVTGFPRRHADNCDGSAKSSVEVGRISSSVSVSAPNVAKLALSADIRFRPKAVVQRSVHFRFRRAAVGKFGGCRK